MKYTIEAKRNGYVLIIDYEDDETQKEQYVFEDGPNDIENKSALMNAFNYIVEQECAYSKHNKYNLSINTSMFGIGLHSLSVSFSDGHTAKEIPDYDIKDGLFNNYLVLLQFS